MVELNEKAVEAACRAWINSDSPMESGIRDAVRAYLSALPAHDDGLVGIDIEQLARTIVLTCQYSWPKDRVKAFERAERLISSALQSKDEQIEKLTREKAYWQKQHDDRTRFLGECATEKEAAEQQVQKLTALVEQAFRDGLTYGGNVDNADADLAWSQSRIRSALETQEGGK